MASRAPVWDTASFDRYASMLTESVKDRRVLRAADSTSMMAVLMAALPNILPNVWERDPGGLLMVATRLLRERQTSTLESKVASVQVAYPEDVASFFAERCVFDITARTSTRDLYDAYVKWSNARGVPPTTAIQFGRLLMKLLENTTCRRVKSDNLTIVAGLTIRT